ncbi:hypothetical protein NDU88_003697 [Pleurodeles waltl]|uniref:Uncharacterized protein n=1 Tax=Pleurodeles waltl TaxID=8319 RepID=A0AAV7M632_PLEWA|nr:hypothetical protein NDU88_003697 [Pleurodeles waltl]
MSEGVTLHCIVPGALSRRSQSRSLLLLLGSGRLFEDKGYGDGVRAKAPLTENNAEQDLIIRCSHLLVVWPGTEWFPRGGGLSLLLRCKLCKLCKLCTGE